MAKEIKSKTIVTFHNKISNNFRQVHVDGAYGGITPPGLINLSFYAERLPIPKSSDYSLNEDFSLGEKLKDSEDSKQGVVREYEFGIYCDLKTATDIKNFLAERIADLQKALIEKNDVNISK